MGSSKIVNMSSLTNGNDYRRGWEEGHQDALSGKDKDFHRMGLSWKFAFHGNTALDSYTEGYNIGYEAGINEKNVVRKVEITNNNKDMDYNSSQAQRFLKELEALKNLNDGIVVCFCDRIRQVNGFFKGYMSVMIDTGVPAEECKAFEEKCYVEDERNFSTLYDRIVSYDLPRIRMYIAQIQKQFQTATGTDIGQINLRTPSGSVSSTLPQNAVLNSNGIQNYSLQINAICNLMDFLVDQRDELRQELHVYEQRCMDMINNGVPKEIYDDYIPNYAQSNVNIINKMSAHIQDVDYPQLRRVYDEIARSLEELGQSANRSPKQM
jgi:hypothetical protein